MAISSRSVSAGLLYELVYRVLKLYTVQGELIVSAVEYPSFNDLPSWLYRFVGAAEYSHSVVYITPVGWDRSLELVRKKYKDDLQPGSVILAHWAPLVGELIAYSEIRSLPREHVPAKLTPDWAPIDRATNAKVFLPLFVTSAVVWLIFLSMFLTGDPGPTVTGMVIGAVIVFLFGQAWWHNR